MVRTQIYLDETQHKELKLRAEQKGTSLSELIREIIDINLSEKKDLQNDPLLQMIGQIDGGKQDSKDINRVVYDKG